MLTIPPAAATEELFDRAKAALRRLLAVDRHPVFRYDFRHAA